MGIIPGSSVAIIVLVHAVLGQQEPVTEPICTSRYDYEHKVLHSIITAEIKLQEQQQRLDSLALNLEADSTTLAELREAVARQDLSIQAVNMSVQELQRNIGDSGGMESNGYTFKDYLAQSTCMALGAGHMYAVRRTCSPSYATCSTVCSILGKTCINSLHVYDRGSIGSSDVGKTGLHMYRYNNCDGGCGPNYCCCQG